MCRMGTRSERIISEGLGRQLGEQINLRSDALSLGLPCKDDLADNWDRAVQQTRQAIKDWADTRVSDYDGDESVRSDIHKDVARTARLTIRFNRSKGK